MSAVWNKKKFINSLGCSVLIKLISKTPADSAEKQSFFFTVTVGMSCYDHNHMFQINSLVNMIVVSTLLAVT